eukprot:g13286.t1
MASFDPLESDDDRNSGAAPPARHGSRLPPQSRAANGAAKAATDNEDDHDSESERSDLVDRMLDEDAGGSELSEELLSSLDEDDVDDDVLHDHLIGSASVAHVNKRQRMLEKKKGATSTSSRSATAIGPAAVMQLTSSLVPPSASGGSSSSSVFAPPPRAQASGAHSSATTTSTRARGGGVGQLIAGGYVSKAVVETPTMKALMKRANDEYLGGRYKACKESIRAITEEMGGGIVSRDVFNLLANVHEKEGNLEKALLTRYFCLTRLGGLNLMTGPAGKWPTAGPTINLDDYKNVIAAFLHPNAGLREARRKEILFLCKKCVAARVADAEVFTTMGQLYEEERDVHSACNAGYLKAFAWLYAFRDAKAGTGRKLLVDDAAQDAARSLFLLRRWDDCVRILEMTAERSYELTGKISDGILLLFGEVLCLHLRDFRRCVGLYFRAWGLARTGDARIDAGMIGPGRVIRRVFGQKDVVRLSWLAIALIELEKYDEVDETRQYHRGSAEAECAICVEAVNSIVDRTSVEDVAGESILHNIVDALLGKNQTEPARRLLQKFEVAKRVSAKTRQRLGQCAYLEKDYKTALKHFEALLELKENKKQVAGGGAKEGNEVGDVDEQMEFIAENEAAVRVQLAEIYVLTKNADRFAKVLSSDLTYANLKKLKKLPPAMSRGDRDQSFRELHAALQKAWEMKTEMLGEDGGDVDERWDNDIHQHGNEDATDGPRRYGTKSMGLVAGRRRPAAKLLNNDGASAPSTPSSPDAVVPPTPKLPDWWLSRFVYLVNDCELDNDRAQSYTPVASDEVEPDAPPQENKAAASSTSRRPLWRNKRRLKPTEDLRRRIISIQEKKKLLALEGIEDVYGMAIWLEFVRFGCEFGVAEVCGRPDLGVDVLETVVYNRRLYLGRSKAAARGVPDLERTSLILALQAQRSRVAFRHIRNIAVRDGRVDERATALLGRLLASSELLFDARRFAVDLEAPAAGTISREEGGSLGPPPGEGEGEAKTNSAPPAAGAAFGSSSTTAPQTTKQGAAGARGQGHLPSSERNACISDYQKWASRHLCSNPESWALMMLVGHCSCMSGRSRFAAKEYARAVAQCPTNSLSLLCLGTNLLSMSMSRVTRSRHAEVYRGLLALRQYQDLRRTEGHEAETWYNLGRGHHLLGLLKFAVQCYVKCLEKIDAARETTRRGGGIKTRKGGDYGETSFEKMRCDTLALQRACAHNLQLLLCHSGNLAQAKLIMENRAAACGQRAKLARAYFAIGCLRAARGVSLLNPDLDVSSAVDEIESVNGHRSTTPKHTTKEPGEQGGGVTPLLQRRNHGAAGANGRDREHLPAAPARTSKRKRVSLLERGRAEKEEQPAGAAQFPAGQPQLLQAHQPTVADLPRPDRCKDAPPLKDEPVDGVKAVFMVLADWGWTHHAKGSEQCQRGVGQAAAKWLKDRGMEHLMRFVLAGGDNFYGGIHKDHKFQDLWLNRYDKSLTCVPWYAVLGNHDMDHWGPQGHTCFPRADENNCGQINGSLEFVKDERRCTDSRDGPFGHTPACWAMPAHSYVVRAWEESLGVTIVGTDGNAVWKHGWPYQRWNHHEHGGLDALAEESKQVLRKAVVEEESAKTLLILNHYPWDYAGNTENLYRDILHEAAGKGKNIFFFGGHTYAGCNRFNDNPVKHLIAGGAGGYCSDECAWGNAGLIVGMIKTDGTLAWDRAPSYGTKVHGCYHG